MKKFVSFLVISFIAAVIACGCNSFAPIAGPIGAVPQGLSKDEVRQAIYKACLGNDWNIVEEDKQSFIVSHEQKQLKAVLRIEYSQSRYSINYMDSAGFPKKGNRIHNHINLWISSLNKKIQRNLGLIR